MHRWKVASNTTPSHSLTSQALLFEKSHCLDVYWRSFSASVISTRHAGVLPLPCKSIHSLYKRTQDVAAAYNHTVTLSTQCYARPAHPVKYPLLRHAASYTHGSSCHKMIQSDTSSVRLLSCTAGNAFNFRSLL